MSNENILEETVEYLRTGEPPALVWVFKFPDAWASSKDPIEMMELAIHLVPKGIITLASCAIARSVLKFSKKEHLAKLTHWIDIEEKFVKDKATKEERRKTLRLQHMDKIRVDYHTSEGQAAHAAANCSGDSRYLVRYALESVRFATGGIQYRHGVTKEPLPSGIHIDDPASTIAAVKNAQSEFSDIIRSYIPPEYLTPSFVLKAIRHRARLDILSARRRAKK